MSAAVALATEQSVQAGPPPLTSEQKRLVRETFARLEPVADLVATLFYLRLFDLDPTLRAPFKGDIGNQGRKFASTLKIAILSLDHEDGLRPTLKLLGVRHRHYGVKAGHHVTFARALIWTLEQSLQKSFTPEAKEAWVAFYAQMVTAMAPED